MQAGRFDQRVAIDAETKTPDDAGGAARSWVEIKQVWAAVWAIGAREQFSAAQPEGVSTYRVILRRRADITVRHRLRWLTNGDQVLNIRGVIDGGPRNATTELLCEIGSVGLG